MPLVENSPLFATVDNHSHSGVLSRTMYYTDVHSLAIFTLRCDVFMSVEYSTQNHIFVFEVFCLFISVFEHSSLFNDNFPVNCSILAQEFNIYHSVQTKILDMDHTKTSLLEIVVVFVNTGVICCH